MVSRLVDHVVSCEHFIYVLYSLTSFRNVNYGRSSFYYQLWLILKLVNELGEFN